MNNKDTKKRVNEIYSSIEGLNKELQEIRENCSHENYHIGNFSWRLGTIDVVKICDYCKKNIGGASSEEYEKFTKEEA